MKKVLAIVSILAALIAFVAVNAISWLAEWHYVAGQERARQGRLDEAIASYESARFLLPERAEYQRAAARLALDQYFGSRGGKFPLYRAQHACSRAIEAEPTYPYNWFEMGRTLMALEKAGVAEADSAQLYFRTALQIDPGNPSFMSGWISWNLSQEKTTAAWKTFVKMTKMHPSTIHRTGPSLLKTKEDKQELGSSLTRYPHANLQYSRYLYDHEEYHLAWEQLQLIPASHRLDRDVAAMMGDVLMKLDQTGEAENVLFRALEKYPDDLGLVHRLSAALELKKDNQASIRLYQQALTHHPEVFEFHVNIGVLAQREGLDDLALTHYQAALRFETMDADKRKKVLIKLGEIRESKGQNAEALAAYQKALELTPADRRLIDRVEKLRLKVKYEHLTREKK